MQEVGLGSRLQEVSQMTVSQMLDLYEEAVRENLRARLDATSHGGRYFDKAHESTVVLDELRDAIEAEILNRIGPRGALPKGLEPRSAP